MNLYQLSVVLILASLASARMTNTTQFWKDTLKTDTMHYQCYSGTPFFIKVFRRLTGTTPKARPPCSTICLPHMDIHPLRPIPEFPSSFGLMEVPEPALNMELLPKTDLLESRKMVSRKLDTPGTSKGIWSLSINHLV